MSSCPQASRTIALTIDPGDRVRASVLGCRPRVSLTLDDLTRHRSFIRRLRASVTDTTSAEWIVEAPSVCTGAGESSCQTLPLADFGFHGIHLGERALVDRPGGSVDDRRWTATKISLGEGGRQFIGAGGPPGQAASLVTAVPSTLTAGGSAFTVTYAGSSSAVTPEQARRVAASRLVHAGRLSPSS